MESRNHKRIAGYVARSIGNGALKLPVLPTIATQVLAITQDESADAPSLSKLITRDQSLAAHVLRVANSAGLGSMVPITSLQQAIARLGIDAVAQATVAASVGKNVFRAEGHAERMGQMWRASLAAAAFAGLCGKVTGRKVDGAFLGGLLHGVGKPVVLKLCVDVQKKLRLAADDINHDAIIADHHRAVSLAIMGRWQIPDSIAEAVAFHSEPAAAPTHPISAAVTALAVALARMLLDNQADLEPVQQSSAVAQLAMSTAHVEELWNRRESVEKIVNAMSV